jgi:predicted anti-sigma-YlaC factor YlaD
VALGIGLLVAAVEPSRARGLLPMAGALAAVMTIGAVADVLDGGAAPAAESVHLLELAGVAGLVALRRANPPLDRRAVAVHP